MTAGTFDINIAAIGADGEPVTGAKLQVKFGSGRTSIMDDAGDQIVFPHPSSQRPTGISLPYTLTLETDKASGEGNSTAVSYEITLTTPSGTIRSGEFAALPAGSSVSLDDIVPDFAGIVTDSTAVRAENAATAAEASEVSAAAHDISAEGWADAASSSAADSDSSADLSEAARVEAEAFATGFSAGTATALAPGASPTLAITGPAGSKVLDLGIPAGAANDPGVEALIKNTGGVGPLTSAALKAAFVPVPGTGVVGKDAQFTAVKTTSDGSNIGFVKTTGTGDSGTRMYVLPVATPTTGVGGVLKIFADPFHLDTSVYRDLGLYFSVDQKGDTGSQGNGVFYINSKAAVGSIHADKNCDIAVTFQDGAQYAQRNQYLPAAVYGGVDRAILVAGPLPSRSAAAATLAALEVQGDIAFDDKTTTAGGGFPGRSIRWWGASSMNSAVSFNQTDLTVKVSGKQALKLKSSGGVVLGDTASQLAANATSGFVQIPTIAGAPTASVLSSLEAYHVALCYDPVTHKLWIGEGNSLAWKSVTFA